MIIINKPIFHPELESGKSIIIKREQLEQHALIVENLEEQLKIAVFKLNFRKLTYQNLK